jgi:two-component system, chemotaxis family, sensor kinase CheA
VRNSIDHGIESSQQRILAGKPPEGLLRLKAAHEAGQVVIEIVDDGGGINPDKIRSKARAMGILDDDRLLKMSDREAIKLVFRPGFSTAEKVTETSGRGVGMDVVQSNLSKVGGAIDIDSVLGKGTSIRIKLPLTLAIIPSLLVSIEGERYAIPQVNLVELVRIPAAAVKGKIENVGGASVMRLRGELLPLVRVSDILGVRRTFADQQTNENKDDRRKNLWDRRDDGSTFSSPDAEKRSSKDRRISHAGAINIVVVAAGEFKYGLIVDKLLDSAEIVVKPLGYHLCDCREYAGATILGDGKVALILDMVGIRDILNMKFGSALIEEKNARKAAESQEPKNRQTILIVENAPGEFFAVALGLISRIEKISTSAITTVGGKRVIQYRGSSLMLFCIEDVAKVQPRREAKNAYVIVFKAGGREVGIVVSDIVDTIDFLSDVDGTTHVQPGILGSAIIHDRVTLFIDLYDIARISAPDLFKESDSTAAAAGKKARVLVVEDSVFFRNQIKAFTEDAGYEVVTADDGVQGLAVLHRAAAAIDLVLTDIEMPNMNGLEFTRAIRNDAQLKHLPVVAVTSMVGDKAQKLGYEAGVDEYLIKLDRERVLAACRRLLKDGREA